jgi:dynein heavy chain
MQMLLNENQRVRAKIPVAFEQLMVPHIEKVETAIDPGLTKLTWTSINISEYMDGVYAALADLELLMDRANDLVEFRINAVLQDMTSTSLCELPDEEPWTVDHFLENTQVGTNSQSEHVDIDHGSSLQMLCARGSQTLQSKSVNVEDAANELIEMLCSIEEEPEDADEKDEDADEDTEHHETSPGSRGVSRASRSGSKLSRPQSTRPDLAAKRRQQRDNMKEAAEELLAHFSHRNLDALIKVTRNTLEGMRKRITSSSMVHYIGGKGIDY